MRAAGADACPARERLIEALDRALGRPLLDALEGRAVEAVITRGAAGWEATLYWRASDGTAAGTRAIHDDGERCDGAVRAVVTSITVALDADAVDAPARAAPPGAPAPPCAPSPAPPSGPASAPSGSPGASPSGSAGAAGSTGAAAGAAAGSAGAADGEEEAEGRGGAGGLRTGGVMLGGVLAVGWLPDVGYGMQLVAEPVVSGRFRFTAVATTITDAEQRFGTVRAGFAAVEFGGDLCATLLSYEPLRMDASLCAGGRGGVVQAFVYNGLTNAGGASGTFALEAGGELRFNPVGPLLVGLTVNGRLNPSQYVLPGPTPDEPSFTQSLAGMVGTLRVGVRFP